MSDQKLRELERRWRETGSVDDEAAYLRERVRVGDLTQERLELAAYCGHEGAMVACSRPAGPSDLETWAAGLKRWQHPALAQAAIIAAAFVHPTFKQDVQESSPTRARYVNWIKHALDALSGVNGSWSQEAKAARRRRQSKFMIVAELGRRTAIAALLTAAGEGREKHAREALSYASRLAVYEQSGPSPIKGPGTVALASALRAGLASWTLTGRAPDLIHTCMQAP